jgi:hypothetical protein
LLVMVPLSPLPPSPLPGQLARAGLFPPEAGAGDGG